ncbi:PAS domain S-box protein, partial [bacterium]|nr:PAS domain S-box protein [bacterium]
RKQAEEALAASEAELRALFASMQDVVLVIDRDGVYRKIAPTNPGPLFKPPEELLGKRLRDVFPAEQAETFLESIRLVLETRQTTRIEYELDIEGRAVWFSTSISPMDKDSTLWVARDVTERKRAEEALRESEERFKTIFEQAPMGIALIGSLTGHIYEVNSRFAEIAGRSMEEMLNIDWMQITHPDDVQADLDNMALLNAGKINGFQMEKRYLHPDGTAVWINMTIAPLSVEDKAHPRHLCMIEDITERKQAEAALAESETRLRTIVQSEPECVKLLDPNGALLDINPAGLAMIEADSLEQVIGVPILNIVTPDHRAAFEVLNARVFRGESGTLEFEIVGLKGTRRWLETHAVPLRNAEGTITSLLGLTRDITQRKRDEQEIRRRAAEFAALYESSQALAGDTSLEDV